MALRDDLMVVIPQAVIDEGYFRTEKVLTVRELRFLRDEEIPRRNRPKLDAWLATFETDPNTVILVPALSTNAPKEWPGGVQVKIKYLRMDRDRRNCTGAYRAFLDTIEPKAELPPGTVEVLREKLTDTPGEVIHYRQMTRLERVAAGLEKDPYPTAANAREEKWFSLVNRAPEFRLRPYKFELTILADVMWEDS